MHVDDFVEDPQRCLRLLAEREEEVSIKGGLVRRQLQRVALERHTLLELEPVVMELWYRRTQKQRRRCKVCSLAA